MKTKITTVFALLALVLTSCSEDTYLGSGLIVSEERSVSSFDKINTEGVFILNIVQGDAQKVEIIGDDNVINAIRTVVRNGELILDLKDGNYKDVYLEANITIPTISAVKNVGAGPVEVTGFDQIGKLHIRNEGSGNFTIDGSGNELLVRNEGSGNINASNFEISIADIASIGSGNVHVHCTDELKVKIDGSGNIYYVGNPSIDVSYKGSGRVIKTD